MTTIIEKNDETITKLDAADAALTNLDDDGQEDTAFEDAIKAARHCIDACRALRLAQIRAKARMELER